MASKKLILISVFVKICVKCVVCVSETDIYGGAVHRSKRQLLFPNSTLLQFNAGIGTPSPAKNVNVNFAFQANFQLPWNRTQIPLDILNANTGYDGDARRKRAYDTDRDYENDAKLFHFYKYVEDVLTGFGHDGKACVRQALCQIGAEPLHSEDDEDLLHELASFVLNPLNDAEGNISEKDESYPYIKAYTQGQKAQNCMNLYSKCRTSFVDIFSKVHALTSN